jgi:hypothetical protein
MASLDREALLELVKEMDQKVDQYLAGRAAPTDVIPDILTTCRRLRAAGLDEAACYWLAAIEHHAAGLDRAHEDIADDEHLFSSSEFLRVHLLRDLSFLRLHIRNAGTAAS